MVWDGNKAKEKKDYRIDPIAAAIADMFSLLELIQNPLTLGM